MKRWIVLAASLFVASAAAGQASMTRQIILGTPLDQRIVRCGVDVEGTAVAMIRPFLEASADFKGKYRIEVVKHSSSGTSASSQSNRFSGRSLRSGSLSVDRPATIEIDLRVEDDEGRALCRLATKLDLTAAPAGLV